MDENAEPLHSRDEASGFLDEPANVAAKAAADDFDWDASIKSTLADSARSKEATNARPTGAVKHAS